MQQQDDVPLTPMVVDCVTFDRAPLGRRGYNEDQVDDFLDRVHATLTGADNLRAREVREVIFDSAPLIRRGYHEEQVDDFLDLVVEEFDRRERTGSDETPQSPPAGFTRPPGAAAGQPAPSANGGPGPNGGPGANGGPAQTGPHGSPAPAGAPGGSPPSGPHGGPGQAGAHGSGQTGPLGSPVQSGAHSGAPHGGPAQPGGPGQTGGPAQAGPHGTPAQTGADGGRAQSGPAGPGQTGPAQRRGPSAPHGNGTPSARRPQPTPPQQPQPAQSAQSSAEEAARSAAALRAHEEPPDVNGAAIADTSGRTESLPKRKPGATERPVDPPPAAIRRNPVIETPLDDPEDEDGHSVPTSLRAPSEGPSMGSRLTTDEPVDADIVEIVDDVEPVDVAGEPVDAEIVEDAELVEDEPPAVPTGFERPAPPPGGFGRTDTPTRPHPTGFERPGPTPPQGGPRPPGGFPRPDSPTRPYQPGAGPQQGAPHGGRPDAARFGDRPPMPPAGPAQPHMRPVRHLITPDNARPGGQPGTPGYAARHVDPRHPSPPMWVDSPASPDAPEHPAPDRPAANSGQTTAPEHPAPGGHPAPGDSRTGTPGYPAPGRPTMPDSPVGSGQTAASERPAPGDNRTTTAGHPKATPDRTGKPGRPPGGPGQTATPGRPGTGRTTTPNRPGEATTPATPPVEAPAEDGPQETGELDENGQPVEEPVGVRSTVDIWRGSDVLTLPLPPAPPGERGYRPGDVEKLVKVLAEAIMNADDGPRPDDIAGLKLSRTFFIGQGYHIGAVEALRLAWVNELRRREL